VRQNDDSTRDQSNEKQKSLTDVARVTCDNQIDEE
jgi:hypothetical protein